MLGYTEVTSSVYFSSFRRTVLSSRPRACNSARLPRANGSARVLSLVKEQPTTCPLHQCRHGADGPTADALCWAEGEGLKGCATRTGKPAVALDPVE
jgi:hypothetical protein